MESDIDISNNQLQITLNILYTPYSWLTDINGMSNYLGLLYALTEYHVYLHFLCCFFRGFSFFFFKQLYEVFSCSSPILSWGCKICQMHLCSGVRSLPECPGNDTKRSDSEVPVLALWGMWSIPSLPLLLSPIRSRLVVPVRVRYMCLIELLNHLLYLKPFNHVQIKINIKLNY